MESPGYRVVWASLCLLLLGTCFGVQAQAPNSAARPGTNAPAKLDYSAFKIISERNIFNPNRSARSAREGGRPQKQAKAADSFSLVGTLSYDKGCFAFFEGTSSQYKKVLKKGGDIAGYTVKEIAHDYVRLESAGKQTEMRVGTRMRKEDEGGWRLLGQSELLASGSQSTNSVENAESASDDESNDVLRKLMQNREEELNK